MKGRVQDRMPLFFFTMEKKLTAFSRVSLNHTSWVQSMVNDPDRNVLARTGYQKDVKMTKKTLWRTVS